MDLLSLLDASFAECADRLAIDLEGRTLTYRDLDREVTARAGFLRSAGAAPGAPGARGARVALSLPKGQDAVFFHLACLRLGVTSIPLNPTCSADEVRGFLADSRPLLLVLPAARADFATRCLPDPTDATAPPRVLLAEDCPPASGSAGAASQVVRVDDGAIATILYTSGTTGRPKGAMLTFANLAANCEALHRAWQWSADDVLLHALPLFHVHGLFVALHGALRAGATTVMTERFDAVRALELLEERRCTVFMGVPTMYHRFLQVDAARRFALEHVRLFACGSAPLGIETFRRFRERFGHTIVERYGMTEVGIATSNPLAGARQEGSVGQPLPGVALRVVDRATRQPVPPGEVGEVEIGGPSVFAGYLDAPEQTAAALTEDRFMRSGDLGHRDAEGYLYLVGRSKELIISGGLNVYPKEVEAALESHPGVLEAAVVGVPDVDLGEAVAAAVVPRPDAPPSVRELTEHVRARLAPYKCPRQIALLTSLPRNAMGKLEKHRLAALPELAIKGGAGLSSHG